MSVVVDESFFSTASVVLFAPTAPSSYSAAAPTSSTQNDTAAMHVAFDDGHSSTDSTDSTKLWALILIFIPIVTILGNLLVIISVLRFKTLHSAINFLILGLAVADLMVALFVMPYAVYVEVHNGAWFIGPLMCDVYVATDVACSTASILLLTVISFDRYRAVSHPIEYSRQSNNVKRVVYILGAIWLISLALASPMVFGLNHHPKTAVNECRFYNADFSILSSIISFGIPCFIILFVYIRIMLALRKREQAARARRASNAQLNRKPQSNKLKLTDTYDEQEDPGRIVAGPVVNMLMYALPSMAQCVESLEKDNAIKEAIELADEKEVGGSETPRSSSASVLSEELDYTVTDNPSDGAPNVSPKSSIMTSRFEDSVEDRAISGFSPNSLTVPNQSASRSFTVPSKINMAFDSFRNFNGGNSTTAQRLPRTPSAKSTKRSDSTDRFIPAFLRALSSRSRSKTNIQNVDRGRNSGLDSHGDDEEKYSATATETETLSAPPTQLKTRNSDAALTGSPSPRVGHQSRTESTPPYSIMRDSFSYSDKRPDSDSEAMGFIDNEEEAFLEMSMLSTNADTDSTSTRQRCQSTTTAPVVAEETSDITPPISEEEKSTCSLAVTFSITTGTEAHPTTTSNAQPTPNQTLVPRSPGKMHISVSETANLAKKIDRRQSNNENANKKTSVVSRSGSFKRSISSICNKKKTSMFNGTSSTTPGLAVRIVKRTIYRKESSIRRKVSKNQRKEKKATKTLGIVVGIFLICWVPFFALNVLNAICMKIGNPSCQVGFLPFFLSTWIGYMNSFMNPIIYTIFNTEFRRAFKSILSFSGKDVRNRHMLARRRNHIHV